MINNEIRLIGVVTTDYEDDTRSEFYRKKKFSLEVERRKGKSDTYTIEVPEKNNLIDTSIPLLGKTIILLGYTSCFNGFVTITAQEIHTIGLGKPRIKNVELDLSGSVNVAEDAVPADDINGGDDELPF